MKKTLGLGLIACSLAMTSVAQTDTTNTNKADTIKMGGIIIIRKGNPADTSKHDDVVITNRRKKSDAKVATNWGIVDLGFANYSDETNYAAAAAQGFVAPGMDKDDLKLRTGKSVNVNIWLFMQRVHLIKRAVSLKYGLGLELNNYRFDNKQVLIQENPTRFTLDNSLRDLKKNKLAADYVTIPVMLSFNLTPNDKNGFGFGGGISAGYLYSARQKFKSNEEKTKNHDDYNLRKWKIAYIGELNLGPVRLYGSYALNSMWEKGLDQTPYAVGLRFSYF